MIAEACLQEEDVSWPAQLSAAPPGEAAITMKQASFAWERSAAAVLRNVSLEVGQGQLVMVVGPVGSGKTSLMHALLGELHSRGGTCQVRPLQHAIS